ncbi:MAG: B12-binding domain-containing radical SAM protein [Alphaproteobacteria bacterium]|nr:B12-binding domain-containing radical SAM protein [Alphaproteobacteria bacterium]
MKRAITLVNLWMTDPGQRYMPLGILWLRAALEAKGVEVELRDYQFLTPAEREDPEALAARLDDSHDIVGFSLMSNALPLAVATARLLRERRPERRVVLGGPGPTTVARALVAAFPWIDLVVRGEGEHTVTELVDALETDQLRAVAGLSGRDADGPFHNPDRALVIDLDTLPEPRVDDLDLSAYTLYTSVTARGCPYKCRFCEIPSYESRRVRRRSVEAVVAELAGVQRDHGVTYVGFQDDIFLLSRRRVEAILDGLEREGVQMQWGGFARAGQVDPQWIASLSERGMRSVAFGIEAGSDRLLDKLAKGLTVKKALTGIDIAIPHVHTRCFFLWGFAEETLEDFFGTAQAAFHAEILGAHPEIGHVVPLGGSPLYLAWKNGPLEFHPRYPFARVIVPPRSEALQQLILDHPAVFSAFYAFPTEARDEKWAMAATMWPPDAPAGMQV